MTVPGIGPITALAFKATIDDPVRLSVMTSCATKVAAPVPPAGGREHSGQPPRGGMDRGQNGRVRNYTNNINAAARMRYFGASSQGNASVS